jgi:signal peptidase I
MNGAPLDNRRLPWLAALLSFIIVGLGQVYAGRLIRGLAFALATGLVLSAALVLLAAVGPLPTVPFGMLAGVAAFGLTLAATLDAYWLAARTSPNYELQPYNHPAAYVLLGLLVMGNSIGYTLHIRSTLFTAFRVSAASMYPTIGVNDRILADRTAYRRTDPQRGDIVVFHPPTGDWRGNHIKRVIALGGDTVSMKDGQLYVNGQPLSRAPVSPESPSSRAAGRTPQGITYQERNGDAQYGIFLAANPQGVLDFAEITVPEHHCFVLGDNRSQSRDSRQFGPIPCALIIGRVNYIYWPAHAWSRFGRLE